MRVRIEEAMRDQTYATRLDPAGGALQPVTDGVNQLLEQIQKRLGRLGLDRGLREYFYRRREAPGGLKQAIDDLDKVQRPADVQKFLDQEIMSKTPPGMTVRKDGDRSLKVDLHEPVTY